MDVGDESPPAVENNMLGNFFEITIISSYDKVPSFFDRDAIIVSALRATSASDCAM